jgi:hypothetical protein
MPQISIAYPIWFLALCLIVGLVYAGAMYWRERAFDNYSKWFRYGMAALRFASAAILTFLLLDPVIKQTDVESKRPVVVVAHDLSQSAGRGLRLDTNAYKDAYNQLNEALKEKFDLKKMAFGSNLRPENGLFFKDKSSNLASVFDWAFDEYGNQNLGAMVLFSDGIYNEGANPLYPSLKLNVPIYTVALGDTTPKKDLYIRKVYNNRIAYLGDKFSIELDVAAYNCAGNQTQLTVSQIGSGGQSRVVSQKGLAIDKVDYYNTHSILVDATTAGIQRFRIALSAVNGEATTTNNVRDIYIEVLDSRIKILTVANAPHPDLGALRQIIDLNKNYQLDIEYINKPLPPLEQYDFIILHQVPGTNGAGDALISQIQTKRKPHLFIVGNQTNLQAYNNAQKTLKINGNINQINDVEPRLTGNFNLFTLEPTTGTNLAKFPPLQCPFGDFQAAPNAFTLLNQKIGTVQTNYPLLTFGDNQGVKNAVLAGEGIWRWRMVDYLQNKNYNTYHDILGKTINYLAVKDDKRRFRAFSSKNIYNENEPIQFDAELYNASYQLINTPDATIVLTHENGNKYNYTFTRSANAYSLNAGYLPVGDYTYKAQTKFNNEQLNSDGRFSIAALEVENFVNTADHNLMRLIANRTGGKSVLPKDMASLAEILKTENKLKPIRYESLKTHSLIHLKWIFFLLLALISAEWFTRRFLGGY